jgi:cytochrome c oxidase subunit 4
MTIHHALDVQKHVKIYVLVFCALAVLTGITVWVSYLEHSVRIGILVALVIASVKGLLVACYFMHLITERKMIYAVLMVTAIFFIALMMLTLVSYWDQQGEHFVPEQAAVRQESQHVP